MNKHIGLLIIFLWLIIPAYATHERAGDITYRHISGLTYEITLVTYTYSISPADRPSMPIDFGDGTNEEVTRNRQDYLGNYINCNYYICRHTYPAAGSYTISTEDPNRNQGIINIPNSVNIPFYIHTALTINNFLTPNNSPTLTNPPIDFGCVGTPFYYNPVAVDPDGDSLSYSLVACRGTNGDTIPGYSLPMAAHSIHIDAVTGDLEWDYPMAQGEYNIAILIQEYRKGVKISSIIRDMQITITACNNTPPDIHTISDTCVTAGDYLHFDVTATDDASQIITLQGMGEVFSGNRHALFALISGHSPLSQQFEWYTSCEHARKQPYLVTFKAQDNGSPIQLTRTHTVSITIVSPAPEQLQAQPFEHSIALSWQPSPCEAYAKGYKIYRRTGAYGYVPSHCETGVPAYTGYQLIATIDTSHSYIDDNKGKGLLHATEYCYMVVAYFADGSYSYASNEACAILLNTAPILTMNSIYATHTDSGMADVAWIIPQDIDSIQFPKPYHTQLYGSTHDTLHYVPLYAGSLTQYRHEYLDSKNNDFFYKIELFDKNNTLIGCSDDGSSVYLTGTAGDKQALLQWHALTPWTNYLYIVQQYDSTLADYIAIDSTADTAIIVHGLHNDITYTFRIKSLGAYSDTTIERPLVNYSQCISLQPIDNEAPPCPQVEGSTDCKTVYLSWPAQDTIGDIKYYYIYYKANIDSAYTLIDSVLPPATTCHITAYASVIGCYAVTAIDSNGNESEICTHTCFDTDVCSRYRLPNIFTPNGDGVNDIYMPYDYDYVESVHMVIYSRWGEKVYSTTNPDILWDGTNIMGKPCSDGVYYYACDVYEYSLKGIEKRIITGTITIMR